MSLKVGQDHKLYYNTGTNASPTWVLICIVGDVSLNISIGNAEIDLRCSNYLMGLPAKIEAGLDFTMARDIGGTIHDALRAIALARTPTQFAVANAAIATTGTQYWKGFMHFTAFPWNQPTQEMSSGDCTLMASYVEEASALVEPAWTTVS